jgi:hypothetical protein
MNPDVSAQFARYPKAAQQALESIRQLILSVAADNQLGAVEETLKWGEASYRVKGGSPVRIDWKASEPGAIKVFFNCQTCLIATFREIYCDQWAYEGKRAIVIALGANYDARALRHCIELAMKYHSLKHLPLLGA